MVPYFGGKGKSDLGGWLFKNFDLKGINNYIEPFSGMFGIYLGEFSDFSIVKNIIYNDIEKQNCNLIRCSQIPINLLLEISISFRKGGLFYCKGQPLEVTFEKYKALYQEYHDEIRKLPKIDLSKRDYPTALMYSFLRLTSYGQLHYTESLFRTSLIDSWKKRFKIFQPLWNSLNDNDLINKLARIKEITADDFKDVMDRYNTPDSFIYCDPPYFDNEKYYDFNMTGVFTKHDHERLARVINESDARIAVSYYDFPELHDYYPKDKFTWLEKEFWDSAGKKKNIEILILKN